MYVARKPPKRERKNAVSKIIWTIVCDNSDTATRYEIGYLLVLITNRKLEVAYGLSIGTDIGDLERRNSPYFALSHRIR